VVGQNLAMAELEVIKHAKKGYRIFSTKSPIIHKFKEFFLEILIIVFAVSITIWFHEMAQHRHQQKEVKEFLIGLKSDLVNDLSEMQSDKTGYRYQQSAFRFFRSIDVNAPGVTDSLTKYTNAIFNKVALVQNSGRYEGFKSSGRIGNIEDKKLQNDILDLYQEMIPSLLNTTQLYNEQKDRFIVFIEENAHFDKEGKKLMLSEVMKHDQARIAAVTLNSFPAEILQRYDLCITRINEIMKAIDDQYDLKEEAED
jgi:hypothetical protein